MPAFHAPASACVPRQRGAVLVTSLLLLLVLTIIGVTVMQMSRMQERMAGNTRDVNLAFQGAEGAVRSGEGLVRAQVIRPVSCSTTGCVFWQPGTAGSTGRVEMESPTWWDTNGQTGEAMANLKSQPTYAIEELGFVRTDGGVVAGQEPPDGRDFYQVSGRSTGGSGLAEVVVQTTFTRKF